MKNVFNSAGTVVLDIQKKLIQKGELPPVYFLQGHPLPGGSFARWKVTVFVQKNSLLVQEVVKDFLRSVWGLVFQGGMLSQHAGKKTET